MQPSPLALIGFPLYEDDRSTGGGIGPFQKGSFVTWAGGKGRTVTEKVSSRADDPGATEATVHAVSEPTHACPEQVAWGATVSEQDGTAPQDAEPAMSVVPAMAGRSSS